MGIDLKREVVNCARRYSVCVTIHGADRKRYCSIVSECIVLIDGEFVESDLPPMHGRKITLLKSKGVRSGGSAFAVLQFPFMRWFSVRRIAVSIYAMV